MSRPYKSFPQEGFAQLVFIVGGLGILIIIGIIALGNIKTTKEFSQDDPKVKGVLLAKGGDDDSGSSGSGDSGSSGSSDSGNSDSGNTSTSGSGSQDGSITNSATPKPTTVPILRTKTEESADETRTEIRFSEGEKIKTRVEEGRTRIDVYSGGIKVRYEIRDGRVIIKAENEAGEEVGLPGEELFKIDDRLVESRIKVATDGGRLVIVRNNIGATSNFPLQIDLSTNQLIASTSSGVKILTILPDQAVQNLIAVGIISKLNPQDIVSQTQSGSISSVQDIIALGERNGVSVYEINGVKEQKLLGFIPISVPTTFFVSAETGQPVAQEQSVLANILDLLSP